jgi:hypothetical protein
LDIVGVGQSMADDGSLCVVFAEPTAPSLPKPWSWAQPAPSSAVVTTNINFDNKLALHGNSDIAWCSVQINQRMVTAAASCVKLNYCLKTNT